MRDGACVFHLAKIARIAVMVENHLLVHRPLGLLRNEVVNDTQETGRQQKADGVVVISGASPRVPNPLPLVMKRSVRASFL